MNEIHVHLINYVRWSPCGYTGSHTDVWVFHVVLSLLHASAPIQPSQCSLLTVLADEPIVPLQCTADCLVPLPLAVLSHHPHAVAEAVQESTPMTSTPVRPSTQCVVLV